MRNDHTEKSYVKQAMKALFGVIWCFIILYICSHIGIDKRTALRLLDAGELTGLLMPGAVSWLLLQSLFFILISGAYYLILVKGQRICHPVTCCFAFMVLAGIPLPGHIGSMGEHAACPLICLLSACFWGKYLKVPENKKLLIPGILIMALSFAADPDGTLLHGIILHLALMALMHRRNAPARDSASSAASAPPECEGKSRAFNPDIAAALILSALTGYFIRGLLTLVCILPGPGGPGHFVGLRFSPFSPSRILLPAGDMLKMYGARMSGAFLFSPEALYALLILAFTAAGFGLSFYYIFLFVKNREVSLLNVYLSVSVFVSCLGRILFTGADGEDSPGLICTLPFVFSVFIIRELDEKINSGHRKGSDSKASPAPLLSMWALLIFILFSSLPPVLGSDNIFESPEIFLADRLAASGKSCGYSSPELAPVITLYSDGQVRLIPADADTFRALLPPEADGPQDRDEASSESSSFDKALSELESLSGNPFGSGSGDKPEGNDPPTFIVLDPDDSEAPFSREDVTAALGDPEREFTSGRFVILDYGHELP